MSDPAVYRSGRQAAQIAELQAHVQRLYEMVVETAQAHTQLSNAFARMLASNELPPLPELPGRGFGMGR